MIDFPVLDTNKLTLRKILIEDVPSLVKYANNKKISEYILNMPYPYGEADAVFRISYIVQGFKSKTRFVFAIILKENGEFIGEVSFHVDSQKNFAELGYWVGEPFWNKGIATEAIGAIVKFGFDRLKLKIIFATCKEENQASQKVLANNGMLKKQTTGSVVQYLIKTEDYELSAGL